MSDLLKLPPHELAKYLRSEKISRFYMIHDSKSGAVRVSHPQLQEFADFLSREKRDYSRHEGVFVQVSRHFDVLHGAFVHRTTRGQAQGGTRFWTYGSFEDYARDGLRLSAGMTHKNSLAGIWWGGGKGVISRDPNVDHRDPKNREKLFREYGEFVTSLRGVYITAEDVGTNTEDIDEIFSQTRFVTCIPAEKGGSGNPSIATARGVIRGMEAALKHMDGGTLEGRSIAVQGMGNVGEPLIHFLFEKRVKKVVACDIDRDTIARVEQELSGKNFKAHLTERGDHLILSETCDVLAPCATGAILNPQTIPQIKAQVICGAANNQLEDAARDDATLHQKGIIYVPDFLVNRMGIVNCANEQYGYVSHDPFIERHLGTEWDHSVYQMTLAVLKTAQDTSEPPGKAAVRLAEQLSTLTHPIFGHRGQQIIDSLVLDGWAN